MTESEQLTELYKQRKLPDGFYWCDVDIYEDGNITKQIESFIHHHPVFYWETSIVRVIELAPSFSEYKSMQEENTKLKELLMSARNYLKSYRDLYSKDNEDIVDFIKEIDQLLADNKIQANTVACNKIQENE